MTTTKLTPTQLASLLLMAPADIFDMPFLKRMSDLLGHLHRYYIDAFWTEVDMAMPQYPVRRWHWVDRAGSHA